MLAEWLAASAACSSSERECVSPAASSSSRGGVPVLRFFIMPFLEPKSCCNLLWLDTPSLIVTADPQTTGLRVGLQQATLPLFHFWSWSQVTFFVSVRDCPSPKYAKLEKWQSGRLFRVRTVRNKFCHFATFPLLVVTGVWCYFCGNNFLTDLGGTICRRL